MAKNHWTTKRITHILVRQPAPIVQPDRFNPRRLCLSKHLTPVNGDQTDWMPARYHVNAVIRWCENRVSLPHSIWFNYSMYSFSAITLQGFIMLYNIKIASRLRS